MLNKRAVYIYQISATFFLMSLILSLQPIMITTLYIMTFITLYVIAASRELKKVSKEDFVSILSVNPNPATINYEVRVKGSIFLRKWRKLLVKIEIDLGDLHLVRGSNVWTGALSAGKEVLVEFAARSDDIGIRFIGPLRAAVFDPLGILVREFEIYPRTAILFLESSKLISQPILHSKSRHPSPGLSKDSFVGMEHEYRISLPEIHEPQAKRIDWKKIARSVEEEVYVKQFDKLKRADLVICIGSGFDIELPDNGTVEAKILQQVLLVTLSHIMEGTRIWLAKYLGDGKFATTLLGYSSFGLKLIEAKDIPRNLQMIYLTRFIDDSEIDAIKQLIESRQIDPIVIAINLGEELLKYHGREYASKILEVEDRRLRLNADQLGLRYSVTDIEKLQETLRRIISFRRRI
ncbi:MAG: hypothetical protein DRN68_03040 [Thaumarchaeota archaeon]|nr:MAG: hypothetical protein DRN68_03040 [Nitrososphaerota archaeon]